MKRVAAIIVALFAAMMTTMGCIASSNDHADDDQSALSSDVSPEYAAYATIVRDAGGTMHPNGSATILGIRGLSSDRSTHGTQSHRAFDDLIIVLEKNGTLHRLAASTHPWELHGVAGVPDVDHDGASDVGMIRPGLYTAKGRGTERMVGGLPAFEVKVFASGSGLLPGWRDVNHDGQFSEDEHAQSEARGDTLSAVLFHRGGDGAPAVVGCQVFDEASLKELITAVGGSSASFNYVLVDVNSIDVSTLP